MICHAAPLCILWSAMILIWWEANSDDLSCSSSVIGGWKSHISDGIKLFTFYCGCPQLCEDVACVGFFFPVVGVCWLIAKIYYSLLQLLANFADFRNVVLQELISRDRPISFQRTQILRMVNL